MHVASTVTSWERVQHPNIHPSTTTLVITENHALVMTKKFHELILIGVHDQVQMIIISGMPVNDHQ